jgi:hypothetical protein
MVDDGGEVLIEWLDGVDDDLWFVERDVEATPAFDALPIELVPARDRSFACLDAPTMLLLVGADALDDGEGRAVAVGELRPFLARLLPCDQVENAAVVAA